MDNELEHRLRRLEAAQAAQADQADQAEQLSRLADGQEIIQQVLTELVRLMTEPDEGAAKLHDVLASLIEAIAVNTATLQRLERSLLRNTNGDLDTPH